MAPRSTNIRTTELTDEFNNDYTGPADMGHGGNENLPNRPQLVSGVGRDGSEDWLLPQSDSGMGQGGNEDLPGAPRKLGGDGRAGLPEDAEQTELMLEANGI